MPLLHNCSSSAVHCQRLFSARVRGAARLRRAFFLFFFVPSLCLPHFAAVMPPASLSWLHHVQATSLSNTAYCCLPAEHLLLTPSFNSPASHAIPRVPSAHAFMHSLWVANSCRRSPSVRDNRHSLFCPPAAHLVSALNACHASPHVIAMHSEAQCCSCSVPPATQLNCSFPAIVPERVSCPLYRCNSQPPCHLHRWSIQPTTSRGCSRGWERARPAAWLPALRLGCPPACVRCARLTTRAASQPLPSPAHRTGQRASVGPGVCTGRPAAQHSSRACSPLGISAGEFACQPSLTAQPLIRACAEVEEE